MSTTTKYSLIQPKPYRDLLAEQANDVLADHIIKLEEELELRDMMVDETKEITERQSGEITRLKGEIEDLEGEITELEGVAGAPGHLGVTHDQLKDIVRMTEDLRKRDYLPVSMKNELINAVQSLISVVRPYAKHGGDS